MRQRIKSAGSEAVNKDLKAIAGAKAKRITNPVLMRHRYHICTSEGVKKAHITNMHQRGVNKES